MTGFDFHSRVPFSFPRRTIEIIVPEGVHLTGMYSYYNNEETGEILEDTPIN